MDHPLRLFENIICRIPRVCPRTECPECGRDLVDYGANPVGRKVLACENCLWTNNGHRLDEEPVNWTADMYEPV